MNIVSIYAPRPEHPYFQDYRPYLDVLRASCARYGHQHLVLTDDPEAIGGTDEYLVQNLPQSLMRAIIAAQYAYLSDPAMADVPTLLTGADCVLAQDPAAFAEFAADLVITTGDFADCRMNCGAIYIRRPAAVAHIWAEALAHVGDDWGDDQTSLYTAIQQGSVSVWELPVDPYNLAPEHPSDDCTRGVVLHFRGPRKRWLVDYCHKWLGLGEGVTLTVCSNTSDGIVFINVQINSRREIGRVQGAKQHAGHAVLVGGGPSLEDTLPEIRRRAEDGQTIFALNGAAGWLMERNVPPDYAVILDPRPDNARFVVPLLQGVYLLASQCSPDVFNVAKSQGQPVALWHFATPGIEAVIPGTPTLIGGGLTVGLTAMALAFHMGYRALHLYGYDSSDRAGAGHAFPQTEDGPEGRRVEVWCNGRPFICGPAMYAQAKAFPEWAVTLAEAGAVITVHGDGLLPEIARGMNCATSFTETPTPGVLAA